MRKHLENWSWKYYKMTKDILIKKTRYYIKLILDKHCLFKKNLKRLVAVYILHAPI